jgi:CRISPR-associated protein Cmr2
LISIGPIQDFIASARKCQDLWFGSWLLSDLARAAATAVRSAAGADALVFPGSLDETSGGKPAVANKILCVVPAGKDPSSVAEAGREGLDRKRDAVAKVAFDRIKPAGFDRKKAEAQVRDLIEFVWVAVPVTGAESSAYANARERAENLLAARKNTKGWGGTQAWAGTVPKSALDGWRESVLDESLYRSVVEGRMSAERLRSGYFVGKGERLCGVGLLKRVGCELGLGQGRGSPVFHSTSHVAAAPLRTHVAQAAGDGRAAVVKFVEALRTAGIDVDAAGLRVRGAQGEAGMIASPLHPERTLLPTPMAFAQEGGSGLDGRVFYESRIDELLEEYGTRDLSDDTRRGVGAALDQCLRNLRAQPTDYYGVLLADGDNMGGFLDRVGGLRGIQGHRVVAGALDTFAIQCRSVIEGHAGSLIYAGGDDVLALVPLHTALGCARRLRTLFGAGLAPLSIEDESVPTLSVGLGIAHHLDDMADARALAKAAESMAKGLPGKDALAVLVQKRSGGRLSAVGRWDGSESGNADLAWRIDFLARQFHEERLPDKVAFDLERECAILVDTPGEKPSRDDEMKIVSSLARRVLGRKRGQGGTSPADTRLLEATIAGASDARAAVRALSQELQIARVFLEAYQIAFASLDHACETDATQTPAVRR